MKFLVYLCLPFFLSILTNSKEQHSFALNFQLLSHGKFSIKKSSKNPPPFIPYNYQSNTKNKKSKKTAVTSVRSLSSTHIQTEIENYQQALVRLCAQEKEKGPQEKFLSFTENTNNLRQFIKEQIQNSRGQNNAMLNQVESYINEEALPYKKILKEQSSFNEKASTLKHFFETYYRHYYRLPEAYVISEELPKILLKTFDCISTSKSK